MLPISASVAILFAAAAYKLRHIKARKGGRKSRTISVDEIDADDGVTIDIEQAYAPIGGATFCGVRG